MYRVEWLQTALDELATIWMQADTNTRANITSASQNIDKLLGENPEQEGESRT